MHLVICPGYHSSALTHDFLQALLGKITPDRLWVLPIGVMPGELLWQLKHSPSSQMLHVIAFSAGVVAAYPLVMRWQSQGRTVPMIAIDGWGMPLPGILSIYRMSHDAWTHHTTYLPTPKDSSGYFYAEPAVEHLNIWQSPQTTWGMGAIGGAPQSMTAMDFVYAALTDGATSGSRDISKGISITN